MIWKIAVLAALIATPAGLWMGALFGSPFPRSINTADRIAAALMALGCGSAFVGLVKGFWVSRDRRQSPR